MALTNVNQKELLSILEFTPAEQNIMIVGKHGIGKSKIVENFFTERGEKVVTFFCSQASDPGDIIGLPYRNQETGKTEFALPWWFPTDNSPVILFLDELNRARPEILQVVMDLTLNRRLAGKRLPEGSMVISAINNGDEYQLTDLDPALLSRFNIYNFVPSTTDWIQWATRSGISQHVIGFISTNSGLLDCKETEETGNLDKGPDRRAWERVSNVVKRMEEIGGKYDTAFKKLVCGIVGARAGVKFFEYMNSKNAVNPSELLYDFDKHAYKLDTLNVQQYVGLNDGICSLIDKEYETNSPADNKKLAQNLLKYFEYITNIKNGKGNREAMAHFISNYELGKYFNLNLLIMDNPNTLEKFINKFITETKTR